MHRGLFVRHAEYHIRAHAVSQAHKLLADAGKTSALFPEFGGQHDGEEHLLSVDCVHFLANDAFYFLRDAAGGRQKRIYAGVDLLDITAANHKRMALNGAVRGFLFVTFAEQFAHSHSLILLDTFYTIYKQFIIAQKSRFDKGG